MNDIEQVTRILDNFDEGRMLLTKHAFTPTAAPAPPMTAGGPPMQGDPNAMPPQGDPNAMPPQGDPNAMPPQGDPNAMPPPGPPMQGDPNAMPPQGGSAIPPELEAMLSDMSNGVQGLSQAMQEQQGAVEQLSQRLLAMEEQQSALRDELKAPAPFDEANAPQQMPALGGDTAQQAPQQEPQQAPQQ